MKNNNHTSNVYIRDIQQEKHTRNSKHTNTHTNTHTTEHQQTQINRHRLRRGGLPRRPDLQRSARWEHQHNTIVSL